MENLVSVQPWVIFIRRFSRRCNWFDIGGISLMSAPHICRLPATRRGIRSPVFPLWNPPPHHHLSCVIEERNRSEMGYPRCSSPPRHRALSDGFSPVLEDYDCSRSGGELMEIRHCTFAPNTVVNTKLTQRGLSKNINWLHSAVKTRPSHKSLVASLELEQRDLKRGWGGALGWILHNTSRSSRASPRLLGHWNNFF